MESTTTAYRTRITYFKPDGSCTKRKSVYTPALAALMEEGAHPESKAFYTDTGWIVVLKGGYIICYIEEL